MAAVYTLKELAELLQAELVGDPAYVVDTLENLEQAGPGAISFLSNPKYRAALSDTQAGAVILKPELAEAFAGNKLLVADPYAAYARLSHCFDRSARWQGGGVHESAWVSPEAEVDPTAWIGPQVSVAAGARIGPRAYIGPNSVIGERAVIGDDCHLTANVTLYHEVELGARVLLHAGAVLGSDGFGFAPAAGRWNKIAQVGRVIVGNDVEIGANACIDRGAVDDTRIHDGVKIDNLVHIAHNVEIGAHTAMAAQVGVAGSTRIGQHCTFAGQVGVVGHITLGDRIHIAGKSVVSNSIKEPGAYASGAGSCQPAAEWRKQAARFRKLDEMARRLNKLEKQLAELSGDSE